MPGFDIFNFLLPRDQVDDIPNLVYKTKDKTLL